MITLRRSGERHDLQSSKQKTWMTFNQQDLTGRCAGGFGPLSVLNEYSLSPGAGIPFDPHHTQPVGEIVTYVRAGVLAFQGPKGRSIYAGEFQRTTAQSGIHLSQKNASRTEWAHVFQIGLHSSDAEGGGPYEQKRFSAAERRDMLCIVASPDARADSLRIASNVIVHSALLDSGQHLAHQLLQGHSAWLHLVEGEATLDDIVLTAGDGVGIEDERAVSFTAWEKSEVLLFDFEQVVAASHPTG